MPALTIRHVTTYRYRQPVAFGEHRMMLRPRNSHDQKVIGANQGQNISDLARQGNWNSQISSIRLFGRTVATVYQDIGYRGNSLTVDRDIPDLAAIREIATVNRNGKGRGKERSLGNWDHQISSLQVQAQRRNR